jgi:hypothetical protein
MNILYKVYGVILARPLPVGWLIMLKARQGVGTETFGAAAIIWRHKKETSKSACVCVGGRGILLCRILAIVFVSEAWERQQNLQHTHSVALLFITHAFRRGFHSMACLTASPKVR